MSEQVKKNRYPVSVKKPYLIQRCQKHNGKVDGTGFDARFEIDYMGSSEFEWGALPASLKVFTRNVDELQIFQVKGIKNYKGQGLWALCFPEVFEAYEQYFKDLIEDKIRLKETTRLKDETTGIDFMKRPLKDNSFCRVDLWWDIDNHIFFSYGKDIVQEVLVALKEIREKKIAENKIDWI